jgi:hypothetical protein
VSANQTIAKLEALLARVRQRSSEPRHAAPAPVIVQPVAAKLAVEDDPIDLDEPDHPTIPPPPADEAPAAMAAVDVAVEVDVTLDEPVAAMPVTEALSSEERLVAVEPAVELGHASLAEPLSPPAAEVEPLAAEPQPEPVDEQVEEPPISSRRPLAPEPEERLADMAFGAVEQRPPLHTPPPESGRLPAAPEVEYAADENTGVHPAMPASTVTAEATHAELRGDENVAAIRGTVRAFQPATFAELLEASLSL